MRGEVGGPDDLVPIGEARIARPGRDVTVVTYGGMLPACLKLATRLADEGIDVEVIDLRSVMPLDLDLIESSVRRTGRVVVVGEAPRFLGIGAEISASIAESLFHVLRAPVVRVGAAHSPIPHSPVLFAALVPGEADIERAVRSRSGRRRASGNSRRPCRGRHVTPPVVVVAEGMFESVRDRRGERARAGAPGPRPASTGRPPSATRPRTRTR